ncbi:alpha/beta hydrolase family protein [Bacillus xiapuensis]|uniref:alpha/beta hydrolase family protein n=1 Tax=Bacillus xiapuensis TaxID=2014075 RepID=UPI000C23E65C|nr:prolyl oligopeptidase family serine peptidase [Bacillus xiapuensis]
MKVLRAIRFPSPNPQVKLTLITYLSGDLKVKGMLAEPLLSGRFDGMLYLRGGIKNVGMVRPARIAQFASEGLIVFAPYYRGNRGGEGNEDFAGNDREDAFSAFDLLQAHPRVAERVHVFGFSRGGVMALWTGIERPAASVVTWGGVSDMLLTYEERKDLRRMMKRVIGGSPYKHQERYDWRTPLNQLQRLQAPVLIIHGLKDRNVSAEHAFRLEKSLKRLEHPAETWYFEQYDHYFPPDVNREIVSRLCEWMKKRP